MREHLRHVGAGYVVAVVATAAAVLLRWLLDPWMGNNLPLVTLYGAVAAAVWYGGYRPALVAAGLGYLACNYLFMEPRGTLALLHSHHYIGLVLYLFTCSLIVGFGEAMRLAQRRTQEGQELLRVTFTSMGDAVITTDSEGRVTSLNQVAVTLTGWTPEEAAGRPLEDVFRIVNEHSRKPVENPVVKVLAEGKIVGLANHTVLIAKDGTERPIDDSAAPIREAGGVLRGVVLIFRDISERRKAEAAQSRLAVIVESSEDAIYSKDLDGKITSWNRGAERLYGYTAEEVIGRPVSILVPPDSPNELAGIMEPLKRGERIERFETVRVHKDGRRVEVSLSVSPMWNGTGKIFGVSVIAQDITARQRAERERRESEERFRLMADAAPVLIWLSGTDKLCSWFNKPWLDFVGRSMAQEVGNGWAENVHPDDFDRCLQTYTTAFDARQPFSMEYRLRRHDGEYRWVLDNGIPRYGPGGEFTGYIGSCVDITDHQRAGQEVVRLNRELRDRLDEWQTVLNMVPVGIGIAHDAECRSITHNPYISELLGVPAWANASLSAPEEERPATYAIHRDGKELPPEQLPMQLACTGVDVRDFECDLVREGQPPIRLVCSARPLRDAEGRIRGSVGVTLDITARKQAEDDLRRAEERTRSVVDNVLDGIITIDEPGVVQSFNPAAERLFGYPASEVVGQNVKILMPEPYQHEHDKYLSNYLRTGAAKIIGIGREVEGRRKDGSTFPMDLAVSEFRLGERRYFTGIVRDITERKRAEDRLRLLLDAAALLLQASDPDLMLRSLFAKIAPHLGLDTYFNYLVDEAGEALRLASCVGVPEETAPSITRLGFGQAVCGTVALQRQPIVATYIQQSDDPKVQLVKSFGIRAYACHPLMAGNKLLGTLSFASRSRDQFDEDELAFLRTITHYVTSAYERLRLVRQLQDADHRKDEFLATLAHELRNPLAPLRNSLELLRLTANDGALIEESRSVMERQVSQMVRLVDDLLDISRITRGKLQLRKERVELADVVNNAIETARPLIEASAHELTVTLPPQAVVLQADPTRLAQVFANLLNNAAKYTEKAGHVWLTAERRGNEAVVSVRDTGIGIPAEHLPHIFGMFSQVASALERSQGGLGIGLSLVKGLVELHGGTIEARSGGPGKGSEFTVHLPILEVPGATPQEPGSDGQTARSVPKCRILVVDDLRDAADSMAMMLRVMGHDTRIAYDGLEAVQTAAAYRPDVVLLDIGLPKMNGYEAARRIRDEPWGGNVALVALTGWGQEEDKRRSLEAGFDHHLTKPVDPAALAKLLALISPASHN